jgi:hypothetical protein
VVQALLCEIQSIDGGSVNKHDVRKGENIYFADDVERLVKPLTIKQLRKFVKIIDRMDSAKLEGGAAMTDSDIDLMIDAAVVILEKADPVLSSNRDAIEEAIDLEIFNKLMNVAMGNSSPEA